MPKKFFGQNNNCVKRAILSCLLLNKDFACAQGNQLVQELLVKVSDTLCRYTEHVHEEVQCQILYCLLNNSFQT